jgi:SRSO17 transposase
VQRVRVSEGEHRPLSAKDLALRLPAQAWALVEWREGSNQSLSSRFAAVRVRPASRDHNLVAGRPVEWLVIEWPEGETQPTKYWLSTLPEDMALKDLVDIIKLRWRIERDYEELKSELGLAQFEGRGWRGFHHHASLCIAAYGFLLLERAAFPPSARWRRERPAVSGRTRSTRPADPSGTTRGKFDRHCAKASDRYSRKNALSMPLLSNSVTAAELRSAFMTQ